MLDAVIVRPLRWPTIGIGNSVSRQAMRVGWIVDAVTVTRIADTVAMARQCEGVGVRVLWTARSHGYTALVVADGGNIRMPTRSSVTHRHAPTQVWDVKVTAISCSLRHPQDSKQGIVCPTRTWITRAVAQ